MSIQGVVTTSQVLLHPALIVSCFGLRTFLRCCRAIILGRRTTFLECAFSWGGNNHGR